MNDRASATKSRHWTVTRIVIGIMAATASAGVVGAFTLAMTYTASMPDRAVAAWPLSSALSSQAAALASRENSSPSDRAQANGLARRALARSPINAEAIRTLALVQVASGRANSAHRLIEYAERLSRRDVPTQMWLIEDRVAANDIPAVLLHYHRAMQTSRESRSVLSPILAQAADNDQILRALVPILRTRPEWWSAFLGDFVERTQSPVALDRVAQSLRLNPRVEIERERLSSILQRYVTLGHVDEGRRFFDQIVPGASAAPIIDGGFERGTGIAPFGWQFAGTAASAGTREARTGARGQFALTLDGNEGQEAARQLLNLHPGSYHLLAQIGSVRPGITDMPLVAINCLNLDNKLVVEQSFSAAPNVGSLKARFTIPPGCQGQWLTIRTARAPGYIDQPPWIDNVAIRPITIKDNAQSNNG